MHKMGEIQVNFPKINPGSNIFRKLKLAKNHKTMRL